MIKQKGKRSAKILMEISGIYWLTTNRWSISYWPLPISKISSIFYQHFHPCVHYIKNGNFSINFPKGSESTKMFDVFGNGIFNLDTESWRNQRKLAQIDNKPCTVALVSCENHPEQSGERACSDSWVEARPSGGLAGLVPKAYIWYHLHVSDRLPHLMPLHWVPSSSIRDSLGRCWRSFILSPCFTWTLWRLQRWPRIGKENKLQKDWETLDRTINEYISTKQEELSKGIPNYCKKMKMVSIC